MTQTPSAYSVYQNPCNKSGKRFSKSLLDLGKVSKKCE